MKSLKNCILESKSSMLNELVEILNSIDYENVSAYERRKETQKLVDVWFKKYKNDFPNNTTVSAGGGLIDNNSIGIEHHNIKNGNFMCSIVIETLPVRLYRKYYDKYSLIVSCARIDDKSPENFINAAKEYFGSIENYNEFIDDFIKINKLEFFQKTDKASYYGYKK